VKEIKFEVTPVSGSINTNMVAIKEQLAVMVSQYAGLVFTEDSKAAAKKTVAELRRLKKDIDDRRKEIKKQWLLPYEKFEAEVKELLAIVDGPIDQINEQVEAFEQKRLKEREIEIKMIYAEEIGDLSDFIPLYRIRDEKWNNISTSTKAIKKAMAETIAATRAGKLAIESMQSDAVPAALKKYQTTLDLTGAINYINQYEAQRAEVLRREAERLQREEEQRHQAEIERVRREERQRIAEEERIRREAETKAIEDIKVVDEVSAAPLTAPDSQKAIYTVVGTKSELQELEMAMTSLGLYFERKDI